MAAVNKKLSCIIAQIKKTTILAIIVLQYLKTLATTTTYAQHLPPYNHPGPLPQHPNSYLSPYHFDESVIVATQQGTVVGRTVYLYDGPLRSAYDRGIAQFFKPPNTWHSQSLPNSYKNVSIFLGIPYAKPPLREHGLRFQLPQQMEKWTILAADKYRPACPQPVKFTGIERSIALTDEDCLYLNIFTPYAKPRTSKLFPVIVHIHGGKFEHGSGNALPGHMLAASQDVVVVTFNYRLGVLGFLATADNSSAGNYGLADQIVAIQWVRDHIENFNGDPQLITLWGTGSGAASAGLIAMSGKGQDLIKRVIAQSGSAMSQWAVQSNPLYIRNTSVVVGEHFGCLMKDTYSLMKCLESKSFNEFTNTEIEPEVGWLPFSPVVDYKTRDRDLCIVSETPSKFFDSPYAKLPDGFAYMSGMTRDDGSVFLLEDEAAQLRNFMITPSIFSNKVDAYIKVFNVTVNQQAFTDAIKFLYSPWDKSNLTAYRQGLVDMYTDSWVLAGHDKLIKALATKRIPTYAYVLNYTIEGLAQPEPWTGVAHDTEYFLATGAPFMEHKYFPSIYNLKDARWTEMDRNMSQLFMEAYGNFAKYGNPTPNALFNNIMWKPLSTNNIQYLSINTTNFTSTMMREYNPKGSQFWNEYIYTLLRQDPVYWGLPHSPVELELRAYKAYSFALLLLTAVFMFMSFVFLCMFFHAQKYKYGDVSVDYMPVPNYGPPSKRVHEQAPYSLNNVNNDHTNSNNNSQQTKPPRSSSRSSISDKHTLV